MIPRYEYRGIYISTFSRSRDTAKGLFAEENLRETALINEVPLRSSLDTEVRMPLWFWNITGRMQWFLNSSRQVEGRTRTRKRAIEFVEILCREESDCAVVTHGFYMHTLLREMKRAGFKTSKSLSAYKNGEYVVAEK